MGAVHYFHFRPLDRVGVDERATDHDNDYDYNYDNYDYNGVTHQDNNDYNGVTHQDNNDLDQVHVGELSTAASDPHVNHL